MNKAVSLLIAYDKFEQNNPNSELEDFCRYYLAQKEIEPQITNTKNKGLLLKIMGRITSAFSLYHKAAMSKTQLPSPEGFYFLNGLALLGEVRKTELINYLLIEYTTGMEAISKLLKDGLINERPDKNDGRAKLISLTEKGKTILSECYAYTSKVSEMIFGDMSDDSINVCVKLLKNIETKHSKLAIELKNKDFDEMYKQIIQ
jgi:DNA-binding MarR family transcriptional regulator